MSARRNDVISIAPILVQLHNKGIYGYSRTSRNGSAAPGSVCLFVCLSVDDYSRTTGYEAAYEQYQQLQCYKGRKNN